MSLRKFDVFPKLENEYRIGTVWGGILSLISITFTIVLSWIEIRSFLNPPIRQRLIVDSARPTGDDGITISTETLPRFDSFINITFPSAPCFLLHFDVIDSVTQLTIPLDEIKSTFIRLSPDGKPIAPIPNNFMSMKNGQCGSCMIDNSTCCTCIEVYNAFHSRGVQPPKISDIPQCSYVKSQIDKMTNEGCRVESSFRAVRVAGEFHVAPGLSWFNEGWHVHDLLTFGYIFKEVNLSHTINRLQFTKTDGPLPLDNFTNIQTKGDAAWRVVYTADILEGNYSASRFGLYDPTNLSPGVFFKYDVSPITATTYLDREPTLHLVTRLLTVIGGVLGMFRFVDTILYSASKAKKKEEIVEQ
ncbi:hypothetical protein TRFO_19886 [Tritrichomonas foetus]|uniref:Endoplasmic reticulum-Golgi intermediate compartment protein 3 n=1 Tax=Tritrichomonas foetus TaxID=1144522 RepID=A0A1J4KH59_9EUKA|nr:hypothetical protein TRFO_19886 [Tritrichomonas foetus]|eukprot:OHT10751.1 hypothetical protein TRFO_19886 [Tritrichomonas foetus]